MPANLDLTMLLTTISFLIPKQHQSFPNVPIDFIQKQIGKSIHGVVISPPLNLRIEFFDHLCSLSRTVGYVAL